MTAHNGDGAGTRGRDYTDRLVTRSQSGWRRYIDVQRPYRWNIARLEPGRCLDVGCGIGRNLAHLPLGSVGVDHNPTSVTQCVARGMTAYLPEDLSRVAGPHSFDTMLVAHVLEHVDQSTSLELLTTYRDYLTSDGRAIVITPQERGYGSDPTHIRWMAFQDVRMDLELAGFRVDRQYSFPLPRFVGRVFAANEFITVASRRV